MNIIKKLRSIYQLFDIKYTYKKFDLNKRLKLYAEIGNNTFFTEELKKIK